MPATKTMKQPKRQLKTRCLDDRYLVVTILNFQGWKPVEVEREVERLGFSDGNGSSSLSPTEFRDLFEAV